MQKNQLLINELKRTQTENQALKQQIEGMINKITFIRDLNNKIKYFI